LIRRRRGRRRERRLGASDELLLAVGDGPPGDGQRVEAGRDGGDEPPSPALNDHVAWLRLKNYI